MQPTSSHTQQNSGFLSSAYRYGFQGQEKDDEIKGEGNSVNYTYRMHDTRLGRFFALDPLAPKYPSHSPYCFVGNMPISAIDPDGREIVIVTGEKDETGAAIKVVYKPGMSTDGLNEFTANIVTALNYIHEHGAEPSGYNKVQKLVDYDQVLTIVESNSWDRTSRFSPELNQVEPGTVYFNDNWGDQMSNGIQSPTVTLAHEIDHAWRFIYYIANYDVSGNDYYWGKAQEFYYGGESGSEFREKEELRVIKGLETRIAKSLNQATRTEYSNPQSIYFTNDVLNGAASDAPAEVQGQIDCTNEKLETSKPE
jgi:RHS repeat-associated protein